jgi:nucleoid-associated protein YgaU
VHDLARWVEDRGGLVAAFALVRLAALAVALWCLALLAASSAVRALGALQLAAVVERGLPGVVRRAAAGATVASVLALVPVAPAGAAGAQDPPTTTAAPGDGLATMQVVDAAGVAVMEAVPEAPPPEPPPEPPPATPAATEPPPRPAPTVAGTWVVAPGESFWSIAEDVVATRLGALPEDHQIEGYWRTLVAANRDRLVSSSPDLLYAGQELVIPA